MVTERYRVIKADDSIQEGAQVEGVWHAMLADIAFLLALTGSLVGASAINIKRERQREHVLRVCMHLCSTLLNVVSLSPPPPPLQLGFRID